MIRKTFEGSWSFDAFNDFSFVLSTKSSFQLGSVIDQQQSEAMHN